MTTRTASQRWFDSFTHKLEITEEKGTRGEKGEISPPRRQDTKETVHGIQIVHTIPGCLGAVVVK
jgi:hypothetical protein